MFRNIGEYVCSRKLSEAGLGGSPADAYEADWQVEFVEDGANGYIVPIRDYRRMGNKLVMLLQDDALRRRMSAEMRRIALSRANRNAIAQAESAVFNRVLNAHLPRAAAP